MKLRAAEGGITASPKMANKSMQKTKTIGSMQSAYSITYYKEM
jgi:hypothetical protein